MNMKPGIVAYFSRFNLGSRGITLLELLITTVIASIAAGVIFLGYQSSVSVWHRFDVGASFVSSSWLVQKKIDKALKQTCSVKQTGTDKWLLVQAGTDTVELSASGKTLQLRGQPLFSQGSIAHFGLSGISGLRRPAFACTLICLQENRTMSWQWTTIGIMNGDSDDIPRQSVEPSVSGTYYWDSR
jgi:hypothetical protein